MPITLQFVVRSTLALLGVGFAALMFIVLASMWLSNRAQTYSNDVASAQEQRRSATVLRENLLAAESSQRGYLLTGNEIYLSPYDTAKSEVRQELDRLTRLLATKSDRRKVIDQLTNDVAEKIDEQDRTISLRDSGGDALAVIKTNRGKALMDEANVYLSALSFESDQRLSAAVSEQASNSTWLRWTTFASAVVIMLVVNGVLFTVHRYTREILAARDEVRLANESLELRVQKRTDELARARDRAEVLLGEVNHRVSNSLALVSSLINLQIRDLKEPTAKAALEETNARIKAIAEVHRHLFTSGNVGQVAADTYLAALLSQLETVLVKTGSSVSVQRKLDPVTMSTNDAINLGIIVTELVTNAFKYAYPDRRGEVRIHLHKSADTVEVVIEDDGVGRDEKQVKGTGFGTRVVKSIANVMRATVVYSPRNPGTEARLSLPIGPLEPSPVA